MIDHQLQVHEDKNNLMQIDQIGGKAKSMGTIDNLLIDKMILEDAHFHKKNLSCTWVDIKKAQYLKFKKKSRLSLFQKPGNQSHEFGCPDESLVAR